MIISRLSRFLVIVQLLVCPITAQLYSKSQIEANKQRYTMYEDCLREQQKMLDAYGTVQQFQALTVLRGASIKLDCFDW